MNATTNPKRLNTGKGIPHHETPLKGSWAPQAEVVGGLVEAGVLEPQVGLGYMGQTSPGGVPAFPGWIGRAQGEVEPWIEEPHLVESPSLGWAMSAGKGTSLWSRTSLP